MAKILYLFPTFGSTEYGAHGQKQDTLQFAASAPLNPRFRYVAEVAHEITQISSAPGFGDLNRELQFSSFYNDLVLIIGDVLMFSLPRELWY